jgi:hypothetical protein
MLSWGGFIELTYNYLFSFTTIFLVFLKKSSARVGKAGVFLRGLLVYWFVGLLVCWSVGLLVCWFVGLLVCWSVGLLVCWSVGLLVC